MTTDVSIRLGELGPGFAARYPSMVRVEKQPAGMDFYEIDWPAKSPGRVRVDHGSHSFVVPFAIGLMASQDLEQFKSEGLRTYTINAGLSAPERISHDEARIKTLAILRGLTDAGWKTTTPRSRPRLTGQARLDYALNVSSSIGLDPAYTPTLEQWMKIESRTPWSFFAGGAYLDVAFTREPTLVDAAKPGAYLLTFTLKTEREYLRGFAGAEGRSRWRELLPAELAKLAKVRSAKEEELRAQGIAIDDSYSDPPVPSLN